MKTQVNLDAIKQVAGDVWQDLGRTRLASVAIGLALALLAVTVIFLRPVSTPDVSADTSYAVATATPAAEDEVSFSIPGEKPLKMKDVDLSAPRDPFQSLDGLASDGGETLLPADDSVQDTVLDTATSGSGATTASTAAYDDTSSLVPIDDLSGATTPTAPTTTDTTPTTTDATTDEGTGTTEAEIDAPSVEPKPREPGAAPVTDYTYAADIQFGRVDDLKRYSRVQRLGLVPSRQLPLVMYLGVTKAHDTAVFMIDSRLSQGGEGRCVPKASQCTFLELRTDAEQDEHRFRDPDGNEYILRLRGLVRTTASAGSIGGRSVSQLEGTPPVIDGAR